MYRRGTARIARSYNSLLRWLVDFWLSSDMEDPVCADIRGKAMYIAAALACRWHALAMICAE